MITLNHPIQALGLLPAGNINIQRLLAEIFEKICLRLQRNPLSVIVSHIGNAKNLICRDIGNRKRPRHAVCFGGQFKYQPPRFLSGIRNARLQQGAVLK